VKAPSVILLQVKVLRNRQGKNWMDRQKKELVHVQTLKKKITWQTRLLLRLEVSTHKVFKKEN